MNDHHYSKIIGCNIHGNIRVSKMAIKIIDTPEFQRMRYIKQLGLCSYIYPAAQHTRFEHSIGVYHLAGKMLENIISSFPDRLYSIPKLGGVFKLNKKIIECIKIAGLAHDLGHGPFSHIFDDVLLKDSTNPNRYHENRSMQIIEMLCKRELPQELNQVDIDFIKSIIHPSKEDTGVIYQIVSNALNGIDVDKFDYLVRDTKNLGINCSFDYLRLINELIIDKQGNLAYPKHSSVNVLDLFYSRYSMHKKVYSHKTVKLVELMMSDIFSHLDSIFHFSEYINDMELFCRLTDNTFFDYINIYKNPLINKLLSDDHQKILDEAYIIYQRLITRNLYQQITYSNGDNTEYYEKFIDKLIKINPNLVRTDFVVLKNEIGFVSGNKADPFESIYFYDKKEIGQSFTIERTSISSIVNSSSTIKEIYTYLVCKNRYIYQFVCDEFTKYVVEN